MTNDSLFFLFLDEIYDSNLNSFRKLTNKVIFSHTNHLHFGMSGVIIPATNLYSLYSISKRIKRRYLNDENVAFHYVDILHKRYDFEIFKKNIKTNKAFIASINAFINFSEFKYIAVFIDKHELIKRYGIFDESGKIIKIKKIGSNLFPKSTFIDYNLYLLSLRKMLVSFYEFIQNRKIQARGIVVAEARGKREDTEMRKAFEKIYYSGISSIQPTQFRRIILDLFIVPKTQGYIGTQLADLVLYPTYDAKVEYHGKRSDHFIDFDKQLKKKLIKDVIIIP